MEITVLSPSENDVALMELMRQRYEQHSIIARAKQRLEWCGKESVAEYEQEIEDAKQRIHEIVAEMIPFEKRYDDEQWSRYWIVTNGNGHVHNVTYCHTCFATTQFAWLPECSGMTEEELVEEFGERVCTVCCPSAPVQKGMIGRRDRQAAEERQAEKTAKRAEKLEKAILPDGSELQTRGYESNPKTLIAAQRLLLDQMNSLGWYGESHPSADDWKANIDLLAEAIARKTGEIKSDVLATAQAKADKKLKKERGY